MSVFVCMKGDENASEGLGKVKERPKKGGEPMNPLKSRMEPLKSLYKNIPRRIFKEAGDAEGGVKFTTPPLIPFGGVKPVRRPFCTHLVDHT